MRIGSGIALASHSFTARADMRTKQQHQFHAAADAKPAHAGIHKVATDAGFVAQQHDQSYDNPKTTTSSTYAHGDGRTLNVRANGNWAINQQGAGAETLKNVIDAGSDDSSEGDADMDAGGPGSGRHAGFGTGLKKPNFAKLAKSAGFEQSSKDNPNRFLKNTKTHLHILTHHEGEGTFTHYSESMKTGAGTTHASHQPLSTLKSHLASHKF